MSAFPRYFLRVGGAGVVVSEMLISTDLGGVEGAGDGASSRGAGSSRGLIQHGPTFGASAVSQWQHLVDPCGREMKMSIVRSSDSAVLSKILMCMPNRSRGDFALRGAPWQCSQLTVFRDDCREGLVRHLARATAGKKRRERRGFSKSRSPDELENHAVTARRQSGSWGAVGQYSFRTEQLHTSQRQAGEESILTRSPPPTPTPPNWRSMSPMFNVECPLFARRRSEHAVYSDSTPLPRAMFLLLVPMVRQVGGRH